MRQLLYWAIILPALVVRHASLAVRRLACFCSGRAVAFTRFGQFLKKNNEYLYQRI